jgi:5-methylcytosine-specific restriction endonuclease McrA
MNKKRTSPIWMVSKEEFVKLYNEAKSVKHMLECFGLRHHGNNKNTLQARLLEEGLSYGNLATRHQNKTPKFDPKPLKEILIQNSNYNRGHLKRRLIKEKIIPYKCQKCGLTNKWNNEDLILVLDHINGINNDNRIENLRFLCPNCNSQTKTFAGRNNYNPNSKSSIKRRKIDSIQRSKKRRKVKRPPYKQLIKEIKESNYCTVGKKYGVSDNAIRKWVKFYEQHENT